MQPTIIRGTSGDPVVVRDDQDAQKNIAPVMSEQTITTVQTKEQKKHADAQRDMFYQQASSGICTQGFVKSADPEEMLLTTILESFQDCSIFVDRNKDALEEMTVAMALEETVFNETSRELISFEGKTSPANRNLFERAVTDARNKMQFAFQNGWYNNLPRAGDALLLAIRKKLADQITQALKEMALAAAQEHEEPDTVSVETPPTEEPQTLELKDSVKDPVIVIEEPKAPEPEVITLPDAPQEEPQVINIVVDIKEPEAAQPEITILPNVPQNAPQEEPQADNILVETKEPELIVEKEPEKAEVEQLVIQEQKAIEPEQPAVDTIRAHTVRDIVDNGDILSSLNAMVRNSAITPVINQNLVKFESSLDLEALVSFKALVQDTLTEVKARFRNAFPDSHSEPTVNAHKNLAAIDRLLEGKNFPGIDEMLPVIVKKLVADRMDRDMKKSMSPSSMLKIN